MTKSKKITQKQIDKCTVAEHHLSLRRRSGDTGIGFIDRLIVFSGPLIPLAVFIQAYNVWILGKGEGLSIITWSLMLFASLTMAAYALKHRTKPLMMVYIPLVTANALVVTGIIFVK